MPTLLGRTLPHSGVVGLIPGFFLRSVPSDPLRRIRRRRHWRWPGEYVLLIIAIIAIAVIALLALALSFYLRKAGL